MWSPDGLLAVANGGTWVYDAHGTRVARFPGQPRAWSPDGSLLAVERGGSLAVVAADGTNARTLVGTLVPGTRRLIPDYVEFTPDGRVDRVRRDRRGPDGSCPSTGGPSVKLPGLGVVVRRLVALRVRDRPQERHPGPRRQPHRRRPPSCWRCSPPDPSVERLLWTRDGRSVLYDTSHPNNDHELYSMRRTAVSCTRSPTTRSTSSTPPGRPTAACSPTPPPRTRVPSCKACALTLRTAHADGTDPTAADPPRRRHLRQRRGLVARRHDDRVRAGHERRARTPLHRAPGRLGRHADVDDVARERPLLVAGRRHARVRVDDRRRRRHPRDRRRRWAGSHGDRDAVAAR